MNSGIRELVRGTLFDLKLRNIFGLVGGLILVIGIIAYYTQKPDEELLFKKLENLGLPIVGKGPQVNVSEALEIGSKTVS
ncbi:hypothetical protein CJF31_00004987 [Rutstroemia sp. NJR-2017a BVV2]|nr:hypothetical protein CJF31_00004987 [Rutstroemia sp. NJR-2017a BVV2]